MKILPTYVRMTQTNLKICWHLSAITGSPYETCQYTYVAALFARSNNHLLLAATLKYSETRIFLNAKWETPK